MVGTLFYRYGLKEYLNGMLSTFHFHLVKSVALKEKMWFGIPMMKQKRYQSILLCGAVFFLFADQNLMAPNLTAIGTFALIFIDETTNYSTLFYQAKEFGFSNAEKNQKLGGDIALGNLFVSTFIMLKIIIYHNFLGFFLVGGVAALLIGYLADTFNRFLLFGMVVVCGELASISTYFVETYLQLFIFRIITGISSGGATPIVFSLLGDMYKQSNRIYASSVVGVAISGGTAAGQLMSGALQYRTSPQRLDNDSRLCRSCVWMASSLRVGGSAGSPLCFVDRLHHCGAVPRRYLPLLPLPTLTPNRPGKGVPGATAT